MNNPKYYSKYDQASIQKGKIYNFNEETVNKFNTAFSKDGSIVEIGESKEFTINTSFFKEIESVWEQNEELKLFNNNITNVTNYLTTYMQNDYDKYYAVSNIINNLSEVVNFKE